jgi:predicted esterase YcpF (UPF0227 family)
MDTSIYYIHGFGSSKESSTLKMLQEYFPESIGLTYDYLEPENSLRELTEQLQTDPNEKIIIGSSLGGWYAEQLTTRVLAEFILYNPQTEPEIGLKKYGIPDRVLEKYRQLKENVGKKSAPRVVILSTDDTVVPYIAAYNKYRDNSLVQLTTGGHRMTAENMSHIVKAVHFMENSIS